jgi:hypothetical protein
MGNGVFLKSVYATRAELKRSASVGAHIEWILIIVFQGPNLECQPDLSEVILAIV